MKKLICLITGITVILGTSGFSFAKAAEVSDTGNTTYSSSSVITVPRTITLNEALSTVENVNPDIQLLDKKIDLLNTQYERDKSDSSAPDGEDLDYDLEKSYNFKESLNNLNAAKSDRAEKLKSIKNDLKKQYLNALSDQKDIDSINESIENLNTKIKNQNMKIQLGQATESSVDSLNTQKANLQTSLNQLNVQLQSELLTIKEYLNLNMSQQLTLADAGEDFVKFEDSNIENRIADAVDKNPDIIKQENSLELLKSKTGIYMNYYSKYENQIRGFQINIDQSRMSLENAKLTTEINLWQSYYNLKNAEGTVDQEKTNLQNAEEDLNIAQTKYNVGTADKTTLEDAKIALQQQKTKVERAINNYIVSSESFQNLLEE